MISKDHAIDPVAPVILRPLALVATLVLLFAACGGSGDADAPTEVASTEVASTEVASTEVAPTEVASTEAAPTVVVPTVVAPTVVVPTATAVIDRVSLHLAFDGENCTFESSTTLQAGSVEFVYFNNSEEAAWVAFNRHAGDETVQDAINHFGVPPSSTPCPSWKEDVVRTSVEPGDTYRWEGELESATYHMVCYRRSPLSVWFGTGLTVEG